MTARTLALDDDGDLLLVSGRLSYLDGRAAIAQRIKVVLELHEGEWFLDLSAGVPYREQVFVRVPDEAAVSALLRAKILGVDGVVGLREFNLVFDYTDRELQLSFVAITDEGDVAAVSAPGVQPWGFVLLFTNLARVY